MITLICFVSVYITRVLSKMKCQNTPIIIGELSAVWVGFDCIPRKTSHDQGILRWTDGANAVWLYILYCKQVLQKKVTTTMHNFSCNVPCTNTLKWSMKLYIEGLKPVVG